MRKLIDPEIMRSCEAEYFRASGMASIDVMEVAARALADAALERFPEARRAFIACGPGGNGGDGYACARMLRDAGLDVRVYPAAPAKSADAIANAARVRELIRDTGVEGRRTPCGAEAQPTITKTARTQAHQEATADSPVGKGIRIPDVALAKPQPSAANAQPADANANQAQFREQSSAGSPVGNGIRIPGVAPANLQPSAAYARPGEAGIAQTHAREESSPDAEMIQAQPCEQSPANPAANGDIRIPDVTPTMPLSYAANAQHADLNANQAQFCEQSSACSPVGNGIRIPDVSPMKPQPSAANAQPGEAGMAQAHAREESSPDAEMAQAQTCEQSPANPAANGDIRIPGVVSMMPPPSAANAQPADANANQAQFCEQSSADSPVGNGIRIPDIAPMKPQPSAANARPGEAGMAQAHDREELSPDAEMIQAQPCEQSPANSTANGGIRIPGVASSMIQLSAKEAHSADTGADRPHASLDACAGGGLFAPCESGEVSEIPDLWIDCLYGTGLSRAPSGAAAELIARMNRDRAAGAKVLAADIPSGLNGATGARFEPCVEADCTVAFQFAKQGHLLGDGLDVCGELLVADVGFPEAAFPADLPAQLEPSDLRGMFAPRRRNIHKGSCGHLLIVAGSFGMAGAAALCARAALRSGVGLVSVACPKSIVPILQGLAPCAMCVPLPERDGAISPEAVEPLRAALRGKSAAVIGPGLSRKAAPEIVAAVLESGLPAVIDADALNLLAENPALKSLLRPHHVLTPHPGEAARLLGHPCANPIADAWELAALGALGTQPEAADERAKFWAGMQEKSMEALNRHAGIPANAQAEALGEPVPILASAQSDARGACGEMLAGARKNPASARGEELAGAGTPAPGPTAVLKGASRVIAGGGEIYVSVSGCPGMARGGSGDVYAGILGALLAEKSGRTPAQSAAAACELHGLAGELAQAKYGPRSMNSADLIEFLPEVFRRCGD